VDPLLDINKERQAIKRAHRIGQQNPVFVEKLIIRNSVEEIILGMQNDVATGITLRFLLIISASMMFVFTLVDRSKQVEITQRKFHAILRSLKPMPIHPSALHDGKDKHYLVDNLNSDS
jgi:hypothetical protein